MAKIVTFLRQFMVSYRPLNTKQVVYCDIYGNEYWFNCEIRISTYENLSPGHPREKIAEVLFPKPVS